MKRCSKIFLVNFLILAAAFLWGTISVNATRWIRLTPEEVDERAEVIAYGQYDFSGSISKSQQYKHVFSLVPFKVEKYYRGSGTERITTGIDMFDLGWVEEAQEEGSSFLLFLERDKDNEGYLIPVAGPNGMVQVIDGKVQNGEEYEDDYYNNILENTVSISPASDTQNELIVFFILLLISGVFILIRKRN